MNRRFFAKSLAILPVIAKETVSPLDTKGVALLSDFSSLLPSPKYLFFCETSLKAQFNKALQQSWKGFRSYRSIYYLIGDKALLPVIADSNATYTEAGMLCFQRVANQWVAIRAMSALHMEGFLHCKDALSAADALKYILPSVSLPKESYTYATNRGLVYLKATHTTEALTVNMVISDREGFTIQRTFASNLFRMTETIVPPRA